MAEARAHVTPGFGRSRKRVGVQLGIPGGPRISSSNVAAAAIISSSAGGSADAGGSVSDWAGSESAGREVSNPGGSATSRKGGPSGLTAEGGGTTRGAQTNGPSRAIVFSPSVQKLTPP